MEVVDAQSRPDGDTKNRILSPFSYVLILLGVGAHLVGFFVFRVVSNPLPTREAIPPFVQFVSPSTLVSGAVLEEQAALFDSAPLFVPGKWNASHNLRPISRERTLLSFSAYGEPQSDFSTALITEGLPVGLESAVTEPADLLALRYWDLLKDWRYLNLTLKIRDIIPKNILLNKKIKKLIFYVKKNKKIL